MNNNTLKLKEQLITKIVFFLIYMHVTTSSRIHILTDCLNI
nr:MAG TPA: hypothetical protein [Caudoviricetes sp.]